MPDGQQPVTGTGQNPATTNKGEATAQDLLSLWAGVSTPTPTPVQAQAPASATPPVSPKPVTPPPPVPAAPAPVVAASAPIPPAVPPVTPPISPAPISPTPVPPRPVTPPPTPLTAAAPVIPRPAASVPPPPPPPPSRPVSAPLPPPPVVPRPGPNMSAASVPPPPPPAPAPRPGPSTSTNVPPPRPTPPAAPVVPRPGPGTPATSVPPPPPPSPRPVSAPVPPPPPRPAPRPMPPPPPPPAPKPQALEGELVTKKPAAPTTPTQSVPKEMPPITPPSAPKKTVPPSTPAAPAAAAVHDEDEPGFISNFKEILEELNITPGSIVKIIGCLVLIVALIYGGIWGWNYYKSRNGATTPPPPQGEEVLVPGDTTGIGGNATIGNIETIDPRFIPDTGIASINAFALEQKEPVSQFSDYVMVFQRLQNLFRVNVEQLLNQSTDRRARLQSHLAMMKRIYDEAVTMEQKIAAELAQVEKDFEPRNKAQIEIEKNFFTQLNALSGVSAQVLLDQFITESKEVVAYRSRYKALQAVHNYYVQGLPRFARRIQDIELNAEPLIAGHKVYDVLGSDLELIVPVGTPARTSGLLAPTTQTQSNGLTDTSVTTRSSMGALPIHPADVSSGQQDFITGAGGGR